MSIAQNDVIQLVNGILGDPGTSSKDHKSVVAKAISLVKEIEFQCKEENARLNAAAVVSTSKVETSKKV